MRKSYPIFCQCEICRPQQLKKQGRQDEYAFVSITDIRLGHRQLSTLPIMAQLSIIADDLIPHRGMYISSTAGLERIMNQLISRKLICDHCYLKSRKVYEGDCKSVCRCRCAESFKVEDVEKIKMTMGECECDYCKGEKREKLLLEVGKAVGSAVVTGIVCQLAIMAAPAALAWAGFTAGGVRAASIAASLHSILGNVRAGSVFAQFMSMGARQALNPAAITVMRSVFGLAHAGGVAAQYFKDKDGKPSFPKTEDEMINLINTLIEKGHMCGYCGRMNNRELKGRCRSVCWKG